MKAPGNKVPHKLGANRRDEARHEKKRDQNFAQSRDVREDRGERQIKMAIPSRTTRGN